MFPFQIYVVSVSKPQPGYYPGPGMPNPNPTAYRVEFQLVEGTKILGNFSREIEESEVISYAELVGKTSKTISVEF